VPYGTAQPAAFARGQQMLLVVADELVHDGWVMTEHGSAPVSVIG
jgi:hypothetical protein